MTESFHHLTWQTREEVRREQGAPVVWVLGRVVSEAHQGPNEEKVPTDAFRWKFRYLSFIEIDGEWSLHPWQNRSLCSGTMSDLLRITA
jgi:hypothetical protein